MGRFSTFQNMSRETLGRTLPHNTLGTVDDIKLGSIMRIADALERIAKILHESSPTGIEERKRDDDWAERLSVAEGIGKSIDQRLKRNWPAWLKTSHAAYRALTWPEWIATLCESAEELKALSFDDIVRLSADQRTTATAEKIYRAVSEMLEAERKEESKKGTQMPKET